MVRRIIFYSLLLSFACYRTYTAEDHMGQPPVLKKTGYNLKRLFFATYYPDTTSDTSYNADGTINYISIPDTPERFAHWVPYYEKHDTIWIPGFINTNGDFTELESLGVKVGTRWGGRCTALFPLSLLPSIDSLTSVMGITPSNFYRPPRLIKFPERISEKGTWPENFMQSKIIWIEIHGCNKSGITDINGDIISCMSEIGAQRIQPDTGAYGQFTILGDTLEGFQIIYDNDAYPVLFFSYTGPEDSIKTSLQMVEDKYRREKCELKLEIGFMRDKEY